MYLLIVKAGHVAARAELEGAAEDFSLLAAETVPAYPDDGGEYELDLDGEMLVWVEKPHEPSLQEQIDALREAMDEVKYAWKPGEEIHVGDRRFFDGKWYIALADHVTLADQTPDTAPLLWEEA